MSLVKCLQTFLLIAFTLASTAAWSDGHSGKSSIQQLISSDDRFTTLNAAIDAAGLGKTLTSDGPFTLFAPTNRAFEKLPPGTLESLLQPENKTMLTSVLSYHLVAGKMNAQQVSQLSEATTLEGESVSISKNYFVKVNHARVTKADIGVSNGVIHAIDQVILPQAAEQAYRPKGNMMY